MIETSNPSPEEIEIRITDTGIGIEREKIGKVFNAFEQGQNSITRRFGGLGLGLAISNAMVEPIVAGSRSRAREKTMARRSSSRCKPSRRRCDRR